MSEELRPSEREWLFIAVEATRKAFFPLFIISLAVYTCYTFSQTIEDCQRIEDLSSQEVSMQPVAPYVEPPRPRPRWDNFDPAKLPRNPNYGDVPTISEEEFAPLAGDWILVEEWANSIRIYPRGVQIPFLYSEDSREWDAIRYGLRIERNRLSFGRIRDTPELLAAPRRVAYFESGELESWQTSVIWGSYGKNLFSKATPRNPPAGEQDLLFEIRHGTDYRGKYELDGNRLYLLEYVLPEMLSKYPMPDSIRVAPKIPAVFLRIFERAESTLPIDFASFRLPTTEELQPTSEARRKGQTMTFPDGRIAVPIPVPPIRESHPEGTPSRKNDRGSH